MDKTSDFFYVSQVQEGNINAFSILIERHKDKAYNLALRICGNHEEAEEVAQDAFLKTYRAINRFRMESSFPTWLYRIVFNTAVSLVRKRKKGMLAIEDFPADALDFLASYDNQDEALEEYRNSLVNFAMRKLPEDERGLITLYYYNDLDIEAISKITGMSKPNIKVKLFRARKKMAETIEKSGKKFELYYE